MHPSKDRLIGVLVDAMKAVAQTRSRFPRSDTQTVPKPAESDYIAAEKELGISFPEDYRLFIAKSIDVFNWYDFGFLFPGVHDDNIVAVNGEYRGYGVVTEQHILFWRDCDAWQSFDLSRRGSTDDYAVIDDRGVDVASTFCNAAHDLVRGYVTSTIESLQERLQTLCDAQAHLLKYDVVVRR